MHPTKCTHRAAKRRVVTCEAVGPGSGISSQIAARYCPLDLQQSLNKRANCMVRVPQPPTQPVGCWQLPYSLP